MLVYDHGVSTYAYPPLDLFDSEDASVLTLDQEVRGELTSIAPAHSILCERSTGYGNINFLDLPFYSS